MSSFNFARITYLHARFVLTPSCISDLQGWGVTWKNPVGTIGLCVVTLQFEVLILNIF